MRVGFAQILQLLLHRLHLELQLLELIFLCDGWQVCRLQEWPEIILLPKGRAGPRAGQ